MRKSSKRTPLFSDVPACRAYKVHYAMNHYNPAYLLLALTLAALGEAHSAHAQGRYIYWIGAIQAEETRGNTIFRYAPDIGVMDTLLQAKDLEPEEKRYFYHLTVDTLHRHIYWTGSGGPFPNGEHYLSSIMRASLDGDNPELFLGGAACGTFGSPTDIELDLVEGAMYWGESSGTPDCLGDALNRTELDNPSNVNHLPVNGDYSASGIALDIRNQMIYWTNYDWERQIPDGILRAPLSDTVSDEYVVTGSVFDIALAHTLSKIYWIVCERSQCIIRRANLDGTDVEEVIVSEALGDNPNINKYYSALTIDNRGQKIYWTQPREGTIRRANLDGTEVELLLSGLVVPSSIALSFGGVSTSVESVEEIPDPIELHGFYPNPVEDTATFEFALTAPTYVTLEIYDQLGRRVEVLASRTYPHGHSSVAWHPTGHANGVYFFRLISSDNGPKPIPLVLRR